MLVMVYVHTYIYQYSASMSAGTITNVHASVFECNVGFFWFRRIPWGQRFQGCKGKYGAWIAHPLTVYLPATSVYLRVVLVTVGDLVKMVFQDKM